MTESVEEVLDREIEEIREQVDALEHDIEALHEHERQNEAREDVLDFLIDARKRQELLEHEETVNHMLRHIEEAYRTAAISEATYAQAKERNKELLG